MAPSSCSSSPSSAKSPSPPPPPTQSPLFTPIQEEVEDDRYSEAKSNCRSTPSACSTASKGPSPKNPHPPIPLHQRTATRHAKSSSKKRSDSVSSLDGDVHGSVSCNRCRPYAREKFSVVPLDNSGVNRQSSSSIPSPNWIFKSILSSLKKSPKSREPQTTPSSAREEHWKIAVEELSHKLVQATRRRDEALQEASRLKCSMSELEKKLNKLEVYCHNLKTGLEECSKNSPYRISKTPHSSIHCGNHQSTVVEHFLVSAAEARSSVRFLSRSLTMQLRHMGTKIYERVSVLLQPYDIKVSLSKNPRSLLFHLEALLNKSFFEDFESVGFQKNGSCQILNPMDRCEANFASFNLLHRLAWEEVLSKGTRYFSEDFSRFCDRKMSEIVAMLGWNRAWSEPLLQAFFGASKSVWLVHLLASSVHPSLPIFRVDKGTRFDSVYMEDMGGDNTMKLLPSVVRIMVAPGFYVHGSVVKCKVLCRYLSNKDNIFTTTISNTTTNNDDKALNPSPSP